MSVVAPVPVLRAHDFLLDVDTTIDRGTGPCVVLKARGPNRCSQSIGRRLSLSDARAAYRARPTILERYLMSRAFKRDASVVGFMPSNAAAPRLPHTRPLAAASAASRLAFSLARHSDSVR